MPRDDRERTSGTTASVSRSATPEAPAVDSHQRAVASDVEHRSRPSPRQCGSRRRQRRDLPARRVAGNGSTNTSGAAGLLRHVCQPSAVRRELRLPLARSRDPLRTFHGFCPGRERDDPQSRFSESSPRICPSCDQCSTSASPGDELELLLRLVPSTILVRRDTWSRASREDDRLSIGRPDRIHVRRIAARELDSALAGNVVDPQVDVACPRGSPSRRRSGCRLARNRGCRLRARVSVRACVSRPRRSNSVSRVDASPRLEVVDQHPGGDDVERRISF